jgi:serine/threonine-protein kinase RsbW
MDIEKLNNFLNDMAFSEYKNMTKISMNRKLKIESSVDSLQLVEKTIDDVSKEIGIKKGHYGKVLISLLEAVNNAIVHGNSGDPYKFVFIEIDYSKEKLKIKVTDEGPGFKPVSIPDPTHPENIESVNGRGIFLMKRLSDEIKFSKKGNSVTMIFKGVTA